MLPVQPGLNFIDCFPDTLELPPAAILRRNGFGRSDADADGFKTLVPNPSDAYAGLSRCRAGEAAPENFYEQDA